MVHLSKRAQSLSHSEASFLNVLCPSLNSLRSQHCSLAMQGKKYLARPLLEVGRSVGDPGKWAGNKVLIRTSCLFCPQLLRRNPKFYRKQAYIMGGCRVYGGGACLVLISLMVFYFARSTTRVCLSQNRAFLRRQLTWCRQDLRRHNWTQILPSVKMLHLIDDKCEGGVGQIMN